MYALLELGYHHIHLCNIVPAITYINNHELNIVSSILYIVYFVNKSQHMFSWYLLMIGCAYFVSREISLLNRNRTKSRIALSAWVPISNPQLINKYSSIFCVSRNVTDNVTILYDLSIIVLGCRYNHFLLQYSYTRYLTLFLW